MHSPYWCRRRCRTASRRTPTAASAWPAGRRGRPGRRRCGSCTRPPRWPRAALIVASRRWSTAPVVFEKTAKALFTVWTYWSPPTSPSVSGGRQQQSLGWRARRSPNGRQMPSKFWIGPEIGPVPLAFWTTGSFAPGAVPLGLSDSIPLALERRVRHRQHRQRADRGRGALELPVDHLRAGRGCRRRPTSCR